MSKIYFYPHSYLRDRQLDVIRQWPSDQVINLKIFLNRLGSQVSPELANASKLKVALFRSPPLPNIKFRPKDAPANSIIYVWGAVIATGKFITDLDNPWALVGYNSQAMSIYKFLLKKFLLSKRCVEIRCMSQACKESLKVLFGIEVYNKSKVYYPRIPQRINSIPLHRSRECRFLFIGTQFEVKGGVSLLKAFRNACDQVENIRLDMITHFPQQYIELSENCPHICIHKANFSRIEIWEKFMLDADVLVLPTYVESFGMVALEALAHGMALILTDVYALRELVEDNKNGILLIPPISIWNGVTPSEYYHNLRNIKESIKNTDTSKFEKALFDAIISFAKNSNWLYSAKQASIEKFSNHFL
jgi:glycosyltransferase involved in cell wall biosynthesis